MICCDQPVGQRHAAGDGEMRADRRAPAATPRAGPGARRRFPRCGGSGAGPGPRRTITSIVARGLIAVDQRHALGRRRDLPAARRRPAPASAGARRFRSDRGRPRSPGANPPDGRGPRAVAGRPGRCAASSPTSRAPDRGRRSHGPAPAPCAAQRCGAGGKWRGSRGRAKPAKREHGEAGEADADPTERRRAREQSIRPAGRATVRRQRRSARRAQEQNSPPQPKAARRRKPNACASSDRRSPAVADAAARLRAS